MMQDLVGSVLGQYNLLEKIGQGGMATVYRAQQASIGREVAIKLLHRSLIEQDSSFLERFRREVQIIAHLQHPHILPVYDFGEVDGQPYIVMAYMTGGTLASYIRQQGQMRLTEIARIVNQLADALDYAHNHDIIHRDFKPGNVLLDEPGNAYLADFGLAKSIQSTQLTATGLIGTPAYMAPDWSGDGAITKSVDIYALGVTLYEMLAGKVPFDFNTPMGVLMAHLNSPIPDVRDERPDLPDIVQEVVAKAMAKSAAERYPTAGALAGALNEVMNAGYRPVAPTISTPLPTPEPFFPAAHFRYNLLAARDVLGEAQLNGVLLLAGLEDLIDNFPPEDIQQAYPVQRYVLLWRTIYEVYGVRGLQAVGRSAGQRVQFHSANSPQNKVLRQGASAVLKKMPIEMRMRAGWKMLARFFVDQGVEIEEMDTHWIWRVRGCPNCWGWKAREPVCYSWSGYLQAEAAWANEGKKFRVVETECRAMGNEACVFMIDKKEIP